MEGQEWPKFKRLDGFGPYATELRDQSVAEAAICGYQVPTIRDRTLAVQVTTGSIDRSCDVALTLLKASATQG